MNAIVDNTIDFDPRDSQTWPAWITPMEATAILRLSLSTVRWLMVSGKLRSRKFGKQRRIPKEALLDFVEQKN